MASPTRPACTPLSQRSMHRVIWDRISQALQTPNVFVKTTWVRPRGPRCFPALLRLGLPYFPVGLHFFPAPALPHGGPAFPPRGRPWRGPALHPVVLLRRFLVCDMATLSVCIRSSSAPLRSSCPPPSPPPNLSRSRRSTPHSCHCSLIGRPRGAPPCLRRCLSMNRGHIARTPSPPYSSPARLSSAPSLPLRIAVPKRPHSVLPIQLPPSSCGTLWMFAPPLAFLPLAPAANIAHRDKDIGDRIPMRFRDRNLIGRLFL